MVLHRRRTRLIALVVAALLASLLYALYLEYRAGFAVFAAKCGFRKVARATLWSMGDDAAEVVPELLALSGGGGSGELAAIECLLALDGRVVLPALLKALDDERSCRRRQAAHILGWMGSRAEPAAPRLRELAKDQRYPEVQFSAAWALREIEAASGSPPGR